MAEGQAPQKAGARPPQPEGSVESRIVCGDNIDVLAAMPEGFVHTCVTSPPYWGLRDYGVPPRIWDAKPHCRHDWGEKDRGGRSCRRCGAWEGCLGLEPTPDLYVQHLVLVMREVRRVLRDDGTLWLNLGDSFASKRTCHDQSRLLKPKDLIGIPWHVAFALQADGWWLRSDIVWAKPNAMPEPIRDRPTRAHEFVFLLSKRRTYFYDAEAVREPDKGGSAGNGYVRPERLSYGGRSAPRGQRSGWVGGGGRNRRSVWHVATQCFRGAHFATFPEGLVEPCILAGSSPAACFSCGAPWRPVISSRRLIAGEKAPSGQSNPEEELRKGRGHSRSWAQSGKVLNRRETVAWEPTCDHDDPGARCTVLDPFSGAATTGIVAARLGRDYLGVELSPAFAQLARQRLVEKGISTEVGK
jgi:DNA modification methylase